MAHLTHFIVTMTTRDDDQTDPAMMSEIISDVLNCRDGAVAAWKEGHDDTIPEWRATFNVYLIVPTEKGDIA